MNRTPAARRGGEAGPVIAAICRESDSAWQAVCALLEHADSQASGDSIGDSVESVHEHAVAVSAALEQRLTPQGESRSSAVTSYRPIEAAGAIAAIPAAEILLSDRALAHAAATALDQLYWPSFTRDWLAERGTSFELGAGDLYPVGEMRGGSWAPSDTAPGLIGCLCVRVSWIMFAVVLWTGPVFAWSASTPPLSTAWPRRRLWKQPLCCLTNR